MNPDDLVEIGEAAVFDIADIELALLAVSLDARQAALMRLIAGAWKRGWDECDRAYQKALAEAGIGIVPSTGPLQ